jgi:hypothetical protein
LHDFSIEAAIIDHETQIQTLTESNAQIIEHLNGLSKLRQQQKAESEKTISELRSAIASLKSYCCLALVAVTGTAALAALASIVQGYQINQLQEKCNARQSLPAQTRKN